MRAVHELRAGRPNQQARARKSQRRRLDDLQLRGNAFTHALHFQDAVARRGNSLGETAETGNQRLGERFHVAPRNGREQHQFHHLIVGQGLGAAYKEALAQSLAMADIMRLGLERLPDIRNMAACASLLANR